MYYLHTAVAEEKLSEGDEEMKSVFLRWLTSYADKRFMHNYYRKLDLTTFKLF